MPNCRGCEAVVDRTARNCPQCGAHLPARSTLSYNTRWLQRLFKGVFWCIAGMLALITLLAYNLGGSEWALMREFWTVVGELLAAIFPYF